VISLSTNGLTTRPVYVAPAVTVGGTRKPPWGYGRSVDQYSDTARISQDLQRHLRRLWRSDVVVGDIAAFGDGHSGFTYQLVLSVDGLDRHPQVLRLSPPGARIAGPADVGRQGRIMDALGAAGLPMPPVTASSSEPVIDGRAFALMDLVAGGSWREARKVTGDRPLAVAAIDVLQRIRQVPVAETGIGGDIPFAPVDELNSWAALIPRCPEFLREPALPLARRLGDLAPPAQAATLVHGDYHYGNLLFDGGSVVAVVDWEIARLGDALLDLGCLAIASLRRKYPGDPNPTGDLDIEIGELIEIYGADHPRAIWFIAVSCFKYAVILGYNLNLHRTGRRIDPIYEDLIDTMRGLIDDGERLLSAD
jgi:aminoglycoside phosphotransferase (APT) family kinase protein